ncbi:MAG: replication-associated recombination protein A [Clostridia bacterium]
MYLPLAEALRPTDLSDIAGQQHLISNNMPLFNIIKSGNIPNMIFYGPSGIGKTTLANLIAKLCNKTFYKLNATTASTGDVKEIIDNVDTLMAPNGILLYLDEIQYFSKKQQQVLLDFIETGKIILIASTTENPYFYVYNAILSRSTVFEFKPVLPCDVVTVIKKAINYQSKELSYNITIAKDALKAISYGCGGDVRKAINTVELLTTNITEDTEITLDMAKPLIQSSSMRYDKNSDVHYDVLSAFQKSIRGSDENAALHYLARLIVAGDIASITRRLLVIASEDIGLAFPNAASIVKSLVDSAFQLGFPEARIPLAEAVILLCTAPKSNSVITAIDEAIADVKSGNYEDIPSHLKDSHYKGAAKLGKGLNYNYPHDFENNYIVQQYLPNNLKDKKYYTFGNNKFEQNTKQYWDKIKKK